MDEREGLAEQFAANRSLLRAVAYQMLGSMSAAEDAVQDAWLRLSGSDPSGIENLGGWLTLVVARVCLDLLRSRAERREEPMGESVPEPSMAGDDGGDSEQAALMADSVGLALLGVLDTLHPAERLAFVLHDIFAMPFAAIAPIMGRSPVTARQLASRARRQVRGAAVDSAADLTPQRASVDALLLASREGDFAGLLAVLDPNVVLRADATITAAGATREIRGGSEVANACAGRAKDAQPALVNGAAGAVWAPGGKPRIIFSFTLAHGKIVAIEMIGDPLRLSQIELTILDGC